VTETTRGHKLRIRQEMLARRRGLPADFKSDASKRICEHLIQWSVYQKAKTVMTYLSMPDEPNLNAVIEDAFNCGKKVCVPFMRQEYGLMDAGLITDLDDLVTSRLNIKMPNPKTCTLVDPKTIDLVVVPGVAFDRNGGRLGMGAGYYDRFLEYVPDAYYLGLAWSIQVLSGIPSASHDKKMHQLLTECGFVPVR